MPDWINRLIDWFFGEWAVIRGAWISFLACVAIATVVIGVATNSVYRLRLSTLHDVIEEKDAVIESKRE
jgi:hypothetical protein